MNQEVEGIVLQVFARYKAKLPGRGSNLNAGTVGAAQGRVLKHVQSVFLLSAGLVFAACGLFDTRDAEAPKNVSSSFVPPTSPELVLANLQNSISERNENDYIRCLVDTVSTARVFEFVPTAAAAARYASVFRSWSLASEKAWFTAITALTPPAAASSLLLSGGFTLRAADSAVYQGDYQLTFAHGIGGAPETTRGNLQFVMAADRASFWSIVRWIDSPSGNDASWSEFKGRFAY
jgi:hypothetical protein